MLETKIAERNKSWGNLLVAIYQVYTDGDEQDWF